MPADPQREAWVDEAPAQDREERRAARMRGLAAAATGGFAGLLAEPGRLFFEIGELAFTARTAEDRVSMREASEAGDEGPVLKGSGKKRREHGLLLGAAGAHEFLQSAQALVLDREVLGVLERHQGEELLEGRQPLEVTRRDGASGNRECGLIIRKCARRPAIDVARELVQHENKRQGASGLRLPGEETTRSRVCKGAAEALSDACVDLR